MVEPDVFHDLFGHVPLLFNPVFADYMQAYGEGGLKASRLDACELLARLYWYTVEFGLIDTPQGLRAYGAGILSSAGELRHSVRSPRAAARGLRPAAADAHALPDRQLPGHLLRHRRLPAAVRRHRARLHAGLCRRCALRPRSRPARCCPASASSPPADRVVLGQPLQHGVQHLRVLQQVHMRMAAQVAVVGAGQRGGRGREDDVVAVAPEAGEAPVALRRLGRGQLQQPGAVPAHLLRVAAQSRSGASQVPWCGVPMVTTPCTRASAVVRRAARRAAPARPCCAPPAAAAGRWPASRAAPRLDQRRVVVDRSRTPAPG